MIRVVHPGSGSRVQGSERHRIPDPDPQPCLEDKLFQRKMLDSNDRYSFGNFLRQKRIQKLSTIFDDF